MDYLIKNVDVADFDNLKTNTKDILIKDGKFEKIEDNLNEKEYKGIEVIDGQHY